LNSLSTLQQLIAKEIELYTANLNSQPAELYDPISYILQLGGKRMRPALLLMACEMFDGDIQKALKPALGIETFHNFTLLHDDIMDKAPLRRNQATVHERWNNDIAILSGDTMFVKSYQLMMQTEDSKLRETLDIFCKTAVEVCEGQQYDMNFESLPNVSIDEYLHMITLKTAVLLAASLQIGGILGGAKTTDAHHLYEFGKNIGIAFQLQDDILDVYGDSAKFGKQVGGDILSNKKTFLLLSAFELAKGEILKELQSWVDKKNFIAEEKVAAITDIYTKLFIRKIAENKMHEYHQKAMHHFNALAVNTEKKAMLLQFSESLLVREI